jgi:hypothetical protein
MKGNPTAGILLLVLASLLIVLGVTDKGKKIISIILGSDTGGASSFSDVDPKTGEPKGKLYDGAEGDPNYKNPTSGSLASTKRTPGAFTGEKGASII